MWARSRWIRASSPKSQVNSRARLIKCAPRRRWAHWDGPGDTQGRRQESGRSRRSPRRPLPGPLQSRPRPVGTGFDRHRTRHGGHRSRPAAHNTSRWRHTPGVSTRHRGCRGSRASSTVCGKPRPTRAAGPAEPNGWPNNREESCWTWKKPLQSKRFPRRLATAGFVLDRPGPALSRSALTGVADAAGRVLRARNSAKMVEQGAASYGRHDTGAWLPVQEYGSGPGDPEIGGNRFEGSGSTPLERVWY